MTVDLTKITTPFGLLDEVYGPGTQEALNSHAGPLEWVSCNGGWVKWMNLPGNICAVNHGHLTIRVKPQPPKPREWWAVFMNGLHVGMWPDRKNAEGAAAGYNTGAEIIHVREVLK